MNQAGKPAGAGGSDRSGRAPESQGTAAEHQAGVPTDGAAAALQAARLYSEALQRVHECIQASRPIWVRGGGTVLDSCHGRGAGSGLPAPSAEILEVRDYRRVLHHAVEDFTITVQAGMTVAELSAILAEARQQLPIDVPVPERTTVGGMIAMNLNGSRRFSRGTVRDLLLGLGIVGAPPSARSCDSHADLLHVPTPSAAAAQFLRAGGRVVKNVAGYDLCKLYTGSWGWLGAIVQATFRVFPIPEAAAAVPAGFEAAAHAEQAIARLMDSPLQPVSIDLMNHAAAADILGADAGGLIGGTSAPLVLVAGFAGLSEDVEAQLRSADGLIYAGTAEAGLTWARLDSASFARVRQAISDLATEDGVWVRLHVLSSRSAELVEHISRNCPSARVASHVGDGVVNALLAPADAAQISAIVGHVRELDGHWLFPRSRDAQAAGLPMLGPSRPDWDLMRRVKAALDPAAIFGRGSPFDLALREGEGGMSRMG